MTNAQPPVPEIGQGNFPRALGDAGSCVLVTMPEPLALLDGALPGGVAGVVFARGTELETLERLARELPSADLVAGFGGGTACDTAKFLAWKWGARLVLAPSIISVDAWLCRSIAVRDQGRVRYIGDVTPERIIVDTDLVRRAPAVLIRAGVADAISICSALGDWLIARDEFGERFDQCVFDSARRIARDLMRHARAIRNVTPDGIAAMVRALRDQVLLCEAWGNARPEEGSEHFLAYCLENITRAHYIHGNLIALNVLTVLRLQRERAVFSVEEMKGFFDAAGLAYRPSHQGIARRDYEQALLTAPDFVRRENLFKGLWWRERVFDDTGPLSAQGVADWLYGLE